MADTVLYRRDARACEHSANATLPERHGRRTAERLGGELEQPGAHAALGVRELNVDRCAEKLSQFCPTEGESVAHQPGRFPQLAHQCGLRQCSVLRLRPAEEGPDSNCCRSLKTKNLTDSRFLTIRSIRANSGRDHVLSTRNAF